MVLLAMLCSPREVQHQAFRYLDLYFDVQYCPKLRLAGVHSMHGRGGGRAVVICHGRYLLYCCCVQSKLFVQSCTRPLYSNYQYCLWRLYYLYDINVLAAVHGIYCSQFVNA